MLVFFGFLGFLIVTNLDRGITIGQTITTIMNTLPMVILISFGPPFLVFILNKMVCWIIAGFRPNSSLDE